MSPRDHEAVVRRLLRSKLVLGVEAVILILIAIALTKQVTQRYAIDRDVARLKQEYQELEKSKGDLEQLIAYFQTDEFKEEEARTKLGLSRPGESVVVLPGTSIEVQRTNQDGQSVSSTDNPHRWWSLFFGRSTI